MKANTMSTLRFFLCFVAMVIGSLCVSAQTNPYPELDEFDSFANATVVNFRGQQPTLVDFVNAYLSDAYGDLAATISRVWRKYLKNKPQSSGDKILVDKKNGYVRIESNHINEEQNATYKTIIEMCYWNCSDNQYKVFAQTCYTYVNGHVSGGWQYDGISFCVYDSNLRKLAFMPAYMMGVEVKTGMEYVSHGYDNGNYFWENSETGERKNMTEEEFEKWQDEYPVVTYNLPREGKDITAVINNRPEGKKEIIVKWNGLRFEVLQ